MSLWLVQAGSHGEYEKQFLDENRIYLTWDSLNQNLHRIESRDQLKKLLSDMYQEASKNAIINWHGQIWAFVKSIQLEDWFVLPIKHKPAIHFGKIIGPYMSDQRADDPYYHYRAVEWLAMDIPRTNFDQDILYSFGAFLTICQIKRNNAEERIKAMAAAGWKPISLPTRLEGSVEDEDLGSLPADLEQIARDQIAKLIIARFKGYGMARLVNGILKAQGFSTYLSPQGPDKGVDILAAPGALGFGSPRICVQVKSGDEPLDRPTLDQLIGTMQNVQADQGLLVSWGGFKSTVEKEKASQFFKVRLWDQDDLIDQLLKHYNNLDDDLKAELPLKRIWTITTPDADGD